MGAPSRFFKGCPQGPPSVDSGLAEAHRCYYMALEVNCVFYLPYGKSDLASDSDNQRATVGREALKRVIVVGTSGSGKTTVRPCARVQDRGTTR